MHTRANIPLAQFLIAATVVVYGFYCYDAGRFSSQQNKEITMDIHAWVYVVLAISGFLGVTFNIFLKNSKKQQVMLRIAQINFGVFCASLLTFAIIAR